MPYLHWESYRRQTKTAEEMTKLFLANQSTALHIPNPQEGFIKILKELKAKHGLHTEDFTDRERVKNRASLNATPLGQYLFEAAQLHDAMDIESDIRVLRDHLYQNPPVHVRRTLYQSDYSSTYLGTHTEYRDQVVYRETKQGKSMARKARLVMVDQLWMYILDDSELNILKPYINLNDSDTIITAFPRRFGRNKPDYSGVHRGIRRRLDHLREGQIQSVYDLGILIMDQCSSIFFDFITTVDERPDVLSIFSKAVGNVVSLLW